MRIRLRCFLRVNFSVRIKSLIGSCAALALALAPVALMGQDAVMESAPANSGGIFVTPIQGAPFSAEVLQETRQILSDGSAFQRKTAAMIARDSQGRIHNERHEVLPANANTKPTVLSIHLFDPETRLNTFLTPATHIARQRTFDRLPTDEPPGNWWNHLENSPANPNMLVTDLGTNVIQGLEVHGYHRALTVPAQQSGTGKPVQVIDKVWYCEELHINLSMEHYDPRIGGLNVTVTSINVNEPDVELFKVPPDYKVVDVTPPGQEDNSSTVVQK